MDDSRETICILDLEESTDTPPERCELLLYFDDMIRSDTTFLGFDEESCRSLEEFIYALSPYIIRDAVEDIDQYLCDMMTEFSRIEFRFELSKMIDIEEDIFDDGLQFDPESFTLFVLGNSRCDHKAVDKYHG